MDLLQSRVVEESIQEGVEVEVAIDGKCFAR